MAERPRFDFAGCLSVAAALANFPATAMGISSVRAASRASALTQWKGPKADAFISASASEDSQLQGICGQFVDDAARWATAWREAADRFNWAVYEEALEEQRAYIAEQKAAEARAMASYEAAVRSWQHFLSINVEEDLSPSDFTNPYHRPATPWAGTSVGDAAAYVPRPRLASTPGPPSFAPTSSFVYYRRDGDYMVPNYSSAPMGSYAQAASGPY